MLVRKCCAYCPGYAFTYNTARLRMPPWELAGLFLYLLEGPVLVGRGTRG